MNPEFLPNNSHLDSVEDFPHTDPQLRRMNEQKYVFHSPIIDELPKDTPGIYNLGGGRQIGKSTLLKQWMQRLLYAGVEPECIVFLSCELIFDGTSLYRIVTEQLSEMPKNKLLYLILDEITYVTHWEKSIKYLADTGAFDKVVVVISGSDLVLMQNARKSFPGRRGKANKVDFHYYPLNFHQYVKLKHQNFEINHTETLFDTTQLSLLYDEFDNYLLHGGFLSAINEYAMQKTITPNTLAIYSDWIRGDMIRHGKSEHFLRELVHAIIKHYSSQISWRNLVAGLSIDHSQTAIDYTTLLESMDAVFIQPALIEDKLVGAPKKQRKFMFCDPFIFHALFAWQKPIKDPFQDQIVHHCQDPNLCAKLVEAVVSTHFSRLYPTFYIKAESEVDVAYIKDNKFWPVEVKWTQQIRPKDLKQIHKYKNSQLWVKSKNIHEIESISTLPLPLALYALNDKNQTI